MINDQKQEKSFSFRNHCLRAYRLFILSVSTYMYFCYFRRFGWSTFNAIFSYLTQWGNLVNHTYFLLNTIMFVDKKPTKRFSIFFNLVLAMNITVSLLFYGVLYPHLPADFFDEFNDVEFSPFLKASTYLMYYTHTIPVIASLIDFYFNRIELDGKGFKAWLGVMICYLTVNAVNALVFKNIIYHIITYTDIMSYVIIAGAIVFAFFTWKIPLYLQRYKLKTKANKLE